MLVQSWQLGMDSGGGGGKKGGVCVCVCVCVLLNSMITEKIQVTTRSKPGRNVRKEMYDPFPPRGDVRPSISVKASLQ